MSAEPPIEAQWLLSAFDQSSDLIAVIDEVATIKWTSSAARRLGGYEPDKLIGRSMLDFIHPEDLERAADILDITGTEGFHDDRPITPAMYRVQHSNGSWQTLEVNASRGATGSSDLLFVLRRADDLVLHDQLLESITTGGDVEDQLDLVLRLVSWRSPVDGYAVLCQQDGGGPLVRSAGLSDPRLTGEREVDGPTPWGTARARQETVREVNLDNPEVLSVELAAVARHAGFEAVIVVPVPDPGHDDDACLILWSTPQGLSVSRQHYQMSDKARALRLVLEWRANHRALERAANVDTLTGVATRQRFFSIAEEALDEHAIVLYIDLDDFKAVNDHHGHSAGDFVLTTTATRIAEALGPGATLGRLGGDEFAVLCPASTTPDEADQLAGAIIEAARAPIELRSGMVTIGASVGIAIRTDDETLDAMLDRADRGLLATKASGKDGWTVER